MKRTFTLLMLLAACIFTASAQTKPNGGVKINLGAEGALPVGAASNGYNYGIGLSVKAEVPLDESLKITGGVGFSSLMFTNSAIDVHKANGDNEESATFVPVKVGIRYYLASRFYAEGQVGAVFGTESGTSASLGITPDSGTSFAYSPGVGVLFPMKGGEGIDIGARYEAWSRDGSTLGFIGLHVAYKFSF